MEKFTNKILCILYPPPLKTFAPKSLTRNFIQKVINVKNFQDNYVSAENRTGRRFGGLICERE